MVRYDDCIVPEIQDFLKVVGWTGQGVRLGRGLVGRSTHALIVFLVVLGIVALRIPVEWLFLVIGAAFVAFVVYFGGVLWYAHAHTGASLLEGSELLHWQKMEIAAKSTGTLPDVQVTQEPARPALKAPDDENEEAP